MLLNFMFTVSTYFSLQSFDAAWQIRKKLILARIYFGGKPNNEFVLEE